MILYRLCCEDGHDFEAWFRDRSVYARLAEHAQIECPYCGACEIVEARIVSDIATSRPVDPAKTAAGDDQRALDVARRILNAVGKIHDYAEAHLDDARNSSGGEAAQASEDQVVEDEDGDAFRPLASHRRDH